MHACMHARGAGAGGIVSLISLGEKSVSQHNQKQQQHHHHCACTLNRCIKALHHSYAYIRLPTLDIEVATSSTVRALDCCSYCTSTASPHSCCHCRRPHRARSSAADRSRCLLSRRHSPQRSPVAHQVAAAAQSVVCTRTGNRRQNPKAKQPP